ncbi:S41 family peptidase [Flavipsychrobacter stenotrophus]|nr:S41 family peptidase [Flavipsychrobacter stenotrophus]
MKAYLANTKGLILDMRCYPKTYMPYIFGRWLKGGKSAFCLHTNMVVDMPGMCLFGTKGINGTDTGSHYKGKLVILVNERSQSASEYASIALASTPGAIVVGDTTAGADGDISIINLPGGGSTMISGIGVLYPDGRETQRVGVKIDKVVRPTLEGIRVRKDEQLEAAIRIIEEQ